MKNILISIFLILTCLLSYGQINSDTSKIVDDSFDVQPFEVKLLSKNILVRGKGKGKAVIRLHLNKMGEINGYDILSYQIENVKSQRFVLSYDKPLSEIKYPPYIQENKKKFDDFIRSKIQISKITDKNVKENNIFIITISLNKKSD